MSDTSAELRPGQVILAFGQAAQDLDAERAQALATPNGWESKGNSARKLFKNLSKEGVSINVLGEMAGQRTAAAACSLWSSAKNKGVGRIWFHLLADDAGWRIEGFSQDINLTTLFLAEKVPAIFRWKKDLGPSDEGASWGAGVLATLVGGGEGLEDHFSTLSDPKALADSLAGMRRNLLDGQDPSVSETRDLGFVDRFAVCFRVEGKKWGDLWWLVLERTADAAQPKLISGAEMAGPAIFFEALLLTAPEALEAQEA